MSGTTTLARAVVQTLCRTLLTLLRVSVAQRGALPTGPALVVANHLGWLDIIAAMARMECAFIAKREVRGWPIVGALAAAMGVVFIDRTRKRDLLRAIPELEARLASGQRVLLFAEGTTGDGQALLPFKSALVEAAIRAQVPVVPVAIRAGASAGDLSALTWLGEETLITSVTRLWALRDVTLQLHIAPAIDTRHAPAGRGARKWATAAAREAIQRRVPHGAIYRVSAPRTPAAARPSTQRVA
jgi:1-acyl-sn-glycerol-3-phosphate acyltransferase